MTTLLNTTIAGSLPKPAWLAEPVKLWAPWRLEGEALAEGKRDAVRLVLRDQERAGIDIVTDGEQTRRHFVTTFIEQLDGVDFREPEDRPHPQPLRRRRAGRDRAGVAPRAGVRRRRAVPARRHVAPRQGHAARPMTMVDTLYDAHYRSREKLAWAFAEILNAEAREIAATGVDVIQFDEPAFQRVLRRGARLGVKTLERAAQGLACTTAVHICYGYGIKATTTGRRRSAANGASTSRPSRCSPPRRSTRSRSSARTRTCRSSSSAF
jgi:5-methyltetrahydropteroyltriglutamate--homocysteine methyltransferase